MTTIATATMATTLLALFDVLGAATVVVLATAVVAVIAVEAVGAAGVLDSTSGPSVGGVSSADVGGPAVTVIVGAGWSGSGWPATGTSSQLVRPTAHVCTTGKRINSAVAGAVNEIEKVSCVVAPSDLVGPFVVVPVS